MVCGKTNKALQRCKEGKMKIIPLREFLSTVDEIHSFVIGWCEIICPWSSRYKMPIEYKNPIKNEFHYYLFGRAMGMLSWIILLIGAILISRG